MEGASAAAHALSLPADAYGNDVSTMGQVLPQVIFPIVMQQEPLCNNVIHVLKYEGLVQYSVPFIAVRPYYISDYPSLILL